MDRLFDSFVRVPVAGEFPDIEYLAGVVGIVGVDVGNGVVPGLEFGVVRIPDGCFPVLHDLVELLDGRSPGSFGEGSKGFVVIAIECHGFATIEFIEYLFVPEQEVVGELACGMAGVGRFHMACCAVRPSTALLTGTNQSCWFEVFWNCWRRVDFKVGGVLVCDWAMALRESPRESSKVSLRMG